MPVRSPRRWCGGTRASSSRLPPRGARPARGSIGSTRATASRSSWSELDLDQAATCDAALVAYPHGAAAELVGELRGADLPVVDISADFRLHDLSDLRAHLWRPRRPGAAARGRLRAHGAPPRAIREAKLVANPGCYPTAALLALAPLAEAGLAEDVVISAASGVSGAGRGGGERLAFVTVDENFSPYAVEGHRHAPEIVQELGELGSSAPRLLRSPPLAARPGPAGELLRRPGPGAWGRASSGPLYEERYADEPFVELVDEPPGVRDVRDTNLCRVHVVARRGRPGACLRRHRQPLEGGGRAGDPEPEPDAGVS